MLGRRSVFGCRMLAPPSHTCPITSSLRATSFTTDGARELCEDADLLIHDSQFTDAEFTEKSAWGHSTFAYAQWVAETCRVKRLALFHHDPARTDRSLMQIASDVAATSSVGVFAAREGETVDVVTCSA